MLICTFWTCFVFLSHCSSGPNVDNWRNHVAVVLNIVCTGALVFDNIVLECVASVCA